MDPTLLNISSTSTSEGEEKNAGKLLQRFSSNLPIKVRVKPTQVHANHYQRGKFFLNYHCNLKIYEETIIFISLLKNNLIKSFYRASSANKKAATQGMNSRRDIKLYLERLQVPLQINLFFLCVECIGSSKKVAQAPSLEVHKDSGLSKSSSEVTSHPRQHQGGRQDCCVTTTEFSGYFLSIKSENTEINPISSSDTIK